MAEMQNFDEFEKAELEEEIAASEITRADDDQEDTTFDLICGYTDADNVLHKTFTLREINGKDEEALNKGEIKKNPSKAVTLLLTRCVTSIGTVTPKSVGAKKWEDIIKSLYVGDQDFMILMLRKISISDEIEVRHECPHCKQKLQSFISVDELEIIPFKGEHTINFELPRGYKDKSGVVHKKGTMRLPTGLDREILTPLAKNNEAKANTVMLTRLCKFADGMPISDDVMSDLVLKDREYLTKLLADNTFGLDLSIEITCDSCGETFRGNLNVVNFM